MHPYKHTYQGSVSCELTMTLGTLRPSPLRCDGRVKKARQTTKSLVTNYSKDFGKDAAQLDQSFSFITLQVASLVHSLLSDEGQ